VENVNNTFENATNDRNLTCQSKRRRRNYVCKTKRKWRWPIRKMRLT